MTTLIEKLEEYRSRYFDEVAVAEVIVDDCIDIVKQHSNWVSISERLPEPYQNVLLFKNGNLNGKPVKYIAIGFIDDDGYWAYDDIFGYHLPKVPNFTTGNDLDGIEFWQLLPLPPSEVQP